MSKLTNEYQLKLTMLKRASGGENLPDSIELSFKNHDDLFVIMQRIREKNFW